MMGITTILLCRSGRAARAAVRGLRRLWGDRRAVSTLEFALLSPVFLGLVVGAVEMGRAAYTQGAVSFAAAEATRYAVVNYNISEEEVRDVTEGCLLGLDPDRINAIVVTGPIDPVDNTRTISVEVSYDFQFTLPLMPDSVMAITGTSRGFLIPPPLGDAPAVTGTPVGCGRS